jgi:hypothetical protein
MANKDTAKQWFVRKAKPTQAQFWQVLDWLRWKDEPVGIGDIDGLTEALQSKADASALAGISNNPQAVTQRDFDADGSYTLQAGNLLESIVILIGSDSLVKIGSVAGTDDIMPDTNVTQGIGAVIVLNIYTVNDMNLFFTGLNANSSIIFISKKLK